ncbi:hypothetical protein G6F24_015247 [Rhizopus arrhizus]|nr:hypothetical protein G6F24_015247 [Rhizopus arrhizus]
MKAIAVLSGPATAAASTCRRTAASRRQRHALQGALLHAAVAPLHLSAAGLRAQVEVGTQRREVRRALIALDIEGDRIAHCNAIAVQPGARLRPGQQRQPQQQRCQYLPGPAPMHVDRPRHRPSLFLRSFSSWNLARSSAPGSSGTRRIHASTACCSSRWRGVVPSLPGTGLPSCSPLPSRACCIACCMRWRCCASACACALASSTCGGACWLSRPRSPG